MSSFASDGVTIDYLDEGEGPLVVLIHGFASNRNVNWVNTGWVRTLTGAGYRVVAPDNRGHGKSQKLYEPEVYRTDVMADDIVRLLTHLNAEKAALLGYSMGARIAAFTALKVPERLSAVVMSGLAANLVKGVGGGPQIADGLEAESASAVTDPTARAFRAFAEQTGSDKRALAACMRASRQLLSEEDVGRMAVPALVVAGDQDEIAGSADWLAARIPGAQAVILPGRDHMTAVGDKGHKQAVLSFLARHIG